MRLLKLQENNELSLVEFFGNEIPPYAILSHTWGAEHEEVTYKDVVDKAGTSKAGYNKIRFCGEQTTKDGLHYFWVDTCCIDKSSSAELQEAINSMFRWYQKAAKCYVYLPDVSFSSLVEEDDYSKRWKPVFRRSKWFTRGWTLQELIAPKSVEFFSQEGQRLGDKQSVEQTLHEITGIAIQALQGSNLSQFTVDERISWAEKRQTKREEDAVYSLLGIFDVYMPLIYGEGRERALVRLKKEIKELHALPSTPSTEQLRQEHEPFRIGFEKSTSFQADLQATDNIETINGDGINDKKSEISKELTPKQLLDLLYFEHIDDRLMSLREAYNKTCEWFLHKEQYKAWTSAENLHEHHGFLWIKGKPGAGKSILMKFLDSEAKRAAKSDTDALVVSFFFNARGDYLEKSTIGLYRSLLWQLFEKAEDLRKVLDEFNTNARRIIERKGWQLEIIKRVFTRAVERLGCRSLQIFIDALDECNDKDVVDMISFLEDIGERAVEVNVRLQICFSSRHYPAVTIRWGMQIVLEDEEEHDKDIARYINSKLKLANVRNADILRARVLEKSAGVFLWVALVIPMLDEASAKGRVEELQKRLDGIPPGLDDLFEMILKRDREDMQGLRHCIQWILFAKRPLKQDEYFFAIRNPISPGTARCRFSGDVTAEVMRLFVHSSSKGLAEVTKTKSNDEMSTVQFIHESVRDFFLVKKGYQKLWPDHYDQFFAYSHEILKDRCLAEINSSKSPSLLQHKAQLPPASSSQMKIDIPEHRFPKRTPSKAFSSEAPTLHQAMFEEFPFLKYAVHHVLYHADAAESHVTKQEIFLHEFPLKYWIHLDNLLAEGQIRRYTPSASLLYILAEQGLPRLIKLKLRRVSHMDIEGEHYCFPMFAACASRNQDAIKAFLMEETIPESDRSLTSQLDNFSKIKPQEGRTPLLCAAEKGYQDIVKLLVETGKVDVDRKDSINGWTPLLWAAGNGHEAIVKLLLETDKVDVDVKDLNQKTPLWWAAQDGHEAVVELLVDTDKVDVDVKDKDGHTPLWWAAQNGHEVVVQLLVDTDKVDVDIKDKDRHTPLWRAVRSRNKAVVKLLVDTGKVDVDIKDKDGRTPLWWAAAGGEKAIVKLLLETCKVDANVKDRDGETPLLLAARGGYEAVVELLLETGKVDFNVKGKDGGTPLSWAVRGMPICEIGQDRYKAIVKLLVEAEKVNVDVKDKNRRTPLWWAAVNKHGAVFKLLMETGKVDVNVKDVYGETPLLWVARRGHQAIAKLLLETGKVDVNVKDKDEQTPLLWAAKNGHKVVVKLLLETGKVDVNVKDKDGWTSLLWATFNGNEAIVQLLVETGKVDINVMDSVYGQTPLSLAASGGNEAILKLLQSHL